MGLPILLAEYLIWHYGKALKELAELEKNFLWFFYYQFSIPLLLKTLFTPFFRIQEEYHGFGLENLFSTLVANTVARVVGLILRLIVLTVGLAVESIMLILAIPIFIIWALLPAVIFSLVVAGLGLVF